MIDAQSITVAAAGCYENAAEGANAVGAIFRRVFWFSILGAAFMGAVAFLQAYVFTGAIPPVPR
jgi:lactate permease